MVTLTEWGTIIRMAQRASSLAIENARQSGLITDPLESSILVYTDDPNATHMLASTTDMADLLRTSGIEGFCTIGGDSFPPDAFEAERDDTDMPRIAAMYFRPPGEKCQRCRKYTAQNGSDCCDRCTRVVAAQ